MKLLKNNILYFIVFFLISCEIDTRTQFVYIKGKIGNLSNGTIRVLGFGENQFITLDSVNFRNGVFSVKIKNELSHEPMMAKFIHRDTNGHETSISFQTKRMLYGRHEDMTSIMIENGIEIEGNLIYPTKIGPKNSIGYIDKFIKTGRQTQVMYNDSIGFVKLTKIQQIKDLIKEHPYSYYYLYELKKRVSDFSNEQFLSLLDCFDDDVQNSKTGKELRAYILNRENKKLNSTTTAINTSGQQQIILNQNATLNMIVLWASWCGPCRKEIPQLKKIYEKYKNNKTFNMVSISLDDKIGTWYKAVKQEQMPWTQLLLSEESSKYARELFSFDGSIPTTLFVDNEGKIIKKFVGYNEKSEQEFEALINKYAVQ